MSNTFEFPDRKNIDALLEDQKTCAEILEADTNNQCLRRVYCRTNLALVEGGVSYIKSATYRFNEGSLRPFLNILTVFGIKLDGPLFNYVVPCEESALLLEEVPTVTQNGEVRTSKRFLDFKTNFKFTFKMVDRIFKTSSTPDYAAIPEWLKLQKAVKTRNRIAHPKHDLSLDIEDFELEEIATGCQWFLDFSGGVFTQISEAVEKNELELNSLGQNVLEAGIRNMQEFLRMLDAQDMERDD